ncbi:MAG TPA: MFS transporter [Solirubrobacterales bacterium]|nr:MFS transporter [Solirubrobacterales bacterium]
MPGSGRLAVLREPDYRRLFLGRTTSLIGDGMAPIAISFAVLDLTGSATDLGLVLTAHAVVMIALLLVGGVVGDRVSPRIAMLGADAARAISTALLAVLLLTGVAEIWQLALLYAIDGAATAFFNPASTAIVPQVVPGRRLQEANALLNISRHGGKVVGPALAGVLLALGSPGSALAVNAATFAVSAACLLGVHAPKLPGDKEPAFFSELRHGWREFFSRKWMVAIVLSAGISNGIFFPVFQVLGPVVSNESLNGSSSWALIMALFGAGGLLGAAAALSLRPRRPLLVGEGLICLIAIPALLLAIPASTAAIAIGALVSATTVGFGEVVYDTVVAQHVPPESLSRVIAYDWFGALALEPIGLALVGPMAAGLGASTTLYLGAAAVTVCQACVLLVPGVRRLEFRPGATGPVPSPRPVEAGD